MSSSIPTSTHHRDLIASEPTREDGSSHAAVIFVWGTWCALLLISAIYLVRYATGLPYQEDWFWIPYVVGEQQPTPGLLWEQMNDHRVPLHKVLFYASYKLFGIDVRPMLWLNLAMLAGLAAILMLAIRAYRGRTILFDAFFPLCLLHPGHGETLLWAQTSVYVSTCFLSGIILALLTATRSAPGPRASLAIALCLILAALCFAGGLLYAAGMSVGLAAIGWLLRGTGESRSRRSGNTLIAAAACVAVLVPAYFVGHHKVRFTDRATLLSGNLKSAATATLIFLGKAFGEGGSSLRFVSLIGLIVALGCAAAFLWLILFSRRQVRPALGPAFHLGTWLGIAAVTGWGRAAFPWNYLLLNRYAVLAAQIPVGLYVLIEFCAPARSRMLLRAMLFTAAAAFLMSNLIEGQRYGREVKREQTAFLTDVRAGVPIPQLIARNPRAAFTPSQAYLGHVLGLLRDAGYRDYRNLPPDPKTRTTRITAPPSEIRSYRWDGAVAEATAEDGQITFTLPEPTFVAGIRFRYRADSHGFWSGQDLDWRPIDDDGRPGDWKTFTQIDTNVWLDSDHPPETTEGEYLVWIHDRIDALRIRPFALSDRHQIRDFELILPADGSASAPMDPHRPPGP